MTNPYQTFLKQDKLFFNAFHYASIGMALVSPDGKWLHVNSALCDIVGYSKEELLKISFQDITHPEDLEEDLDYINKLLGGEIETYQMEKRYFHKNGSIIHILLSVSLVRSETNDTPQFFISQIQDITDRKILEEELIKQAKIDSLTGVNNRRHFYELAEKEFVRGDRYNENMVALMIDIDHFKHINDTYGHDAGDRVLQKMAKVCESGFRKFDIFGRIGGEEFGALIINSNLDQGHTIADRIRKSLEQVLIPEDNQIVRFTVSIGGVAFSGGNVSLQERLKQADEALYTAKSSGRNKVIIIDDTPPEKDKELKHKIVQLEWSPSYLSGNKTIDHQHQKLFTLSNTLVNSLVNSQKKNDCLRYIDLLNKEIAHHFATEEKILKDAKYVHFKRHKRLHAALLNDAKELADNYRGGKTGVGEVFQFIVMKVVNEHMLREDSLFFDHI